LLIFQIQTSARFTGDFNALLITFHSFHSIYKASVSSYSCHFQNARPSTKFEITTLTFGQLSSIFFVILTIQQLAVDETASNPDFTNIIYTELIWKT